MIGGELVTALAEASGGEAAAGRLRALGAVPAHPRRAAGHGRAAGDHRIRRAVPRPHRPRRGHPRGGARPSDLGDGGPDHDRLRHADEQGLRDDRGAPLLRRALRARSTSSCTRSRSSTRWSTSTTAPRSPTSATPTCGCRSPTRCTSPSAPTSTCRRSTWPRPGELTFEPPDTRRVPLPAARPRGGGGGGHRPLRAQRRRRGRGRGLPRRPTAFTGDRRGGRADAGRDAGRAGLALRGPVRGRRGGARARRGPDRRDGRSREPASLAIRRLHGC